MPTFLRHPVAIYGEQRIMFHPQPARIKATSNPDTLYRAIVTQPSALTNIPRQAGRARLIQACQHAWNWEWTVEELEEDSRQFSAHVALFFLAGHTEPVYPAVCENTPLPGLWDPRGHYVQSCFGRWALTGRYFYDSHSGVYWLETYGVQLGGDIRERTTKYGAIGLQVHSHQLPSFIPRHQVRWRIQRRKVEATLLRIFPYPLPPHYQFEWEFFRFQGTGTPNRPPAILEVEGDHPLAARTPLSLSPAAVAWPAFDSPITFRPRGSFSEDGSDAFSDSNRGSDTDQDSLFDRT
jgi:hypothetical protein